MTPESQEDEIQAQLLTIKLIAENRDLVHENALLLKKLDEKNTKFSILVGFAMIIGFVSTFVIERLVLPWLKGEF